MATTCTNSLESHLKRVEEAERTVDRVLQSMRSGTVTPQLMTQLDAAIEAQIKALTEDVAVEGRAGRSK